MIALAVFILILPDLHLVRALLLSFPCLRLPLLVCFWFVWVSVLRLGVSVVISRVFVAPLCFMWVVVFLWGRVKDFGMGTLVVRGFLRVVIV